MRKDCENTKSFLPVNVSLVIIDLMSYYLHKLLLFRQRYMHAALEKDFSINDLTNPSKFLIKLPMLSTPEFARRATTLWVYILVGFNKVLIHLTLFLLFSAKTRDAMYQVIHDICTLILILTRLTFSVASLGVRAT